MAALSPRPSASGGLTTVFRDRSEPQRPSRRGRGLSPNFVVMGIQAWSAQLAHKALTSEGAAKAITDRHGEIIRQAQYNSAPVRTGQTRDSIRADRNAVPGGYEVDIGPIYSRSRAPVARYLVFGTIKMSRKWDLFGASQPGINSWQEQMEELARL